MAIDRDPTEIRVQEIADAFTSSINTADEQRAQRLEALQQLRKAKVGGFERDHARLIRKLGPKHPRVAQLAGQIAVNRALAQNIGAEIGRARTQPVGQEKEAWILHGRVLDSQFRSQPGLTVALYDDRNVWNERAGYACTDQTGYFKLRLPVGGGAAPAVAADEKRGAGRGKNRAADDAHVLYAHVLDANSKTLCVDRRGQAPAAGTVDYIEIILGEAPGNCVPPKGSKRPQPGATKR